MPSITKSFSTSPDLLSKTVTLFGDGKKIVEPRPSPSGSFESMTWPQTPCTKEIGDEEPCYSTKISIFSFIWAGLAALHKASTI